MVYHKVSVPGGEHHTVHLSVAEVHKALILERIIGSVFFVSFAFTFELFGDMLFLWVRLIGFRLKTNTENRNNQWYNILLSVLYT